MRGRSERVAPLVAVLVLAACTGDDGGREPGGVERQSTAPTTTDAPARPARLEKAVRCPMPVPAEVTVEVECSWLVVPEDRADADSRDIRLAVARLRSRAVKSRPDPVVQLQGGPGFPSLENVVGQSRSAILDTRDLILWDQRGVGFSEPNLDCPEVDEAIWGLFATADPPAEEGERIDAALVTCRGRVVDDGADLDGYDTTLNAADLADLRVALDIEEWNLRGVSYGSALAIETVRNHPEGIRSVLLDSVIPPDDPFGALERGEGALRAYRALAEACADDTGCASTYGDVEDLIARTARALDADPYRSTVTDPATGRKRPIAITGGDIYAGVFNAMYDDDLIPAIPSVLTAILRGERAIIDTLATEGIAFASGQAEAMTASVNCADRQRILDATALAQLLEDHPELGTLVHLITPETGCERWGVPPAAAPFNELLGPDTDVPIVVMAGRFDPITPPDGSRRVAEALGLELLTFPDVGHGAVGSSECARAIWVAFMDDPSSEPDASCVAAQEPPDFA